MSWHCTCIVYVIIHVAVQVVSTRHLKGHHSVFGNNYKDECMSGLLKCVPREDCIARTPGDNIEGRQCPPNFDAHHGYCVFVGKPDRVTLRSQTQARDFCNVLDTRQFYFQSSQEWKDLEAEVEKAGSTLLDRDRPFWLDAHWDEEDHRWEWRTTKEEIHWHKILQGTECEEKNKLEVKKEENCLAVRYDSTDKCLRLKMFECFKALRSLCKTGIHNSQCGEGSGSVCCFSPTYEYYSQHERDPLTNNALDAYNECWVSLPGQGLVIECRKAIDLIPKMVRIGNSFFYLTENADCRGERKAVISNEEVHSFIVRYLLTMEKKSKNKQYLIGMNYDQSRDEFHWANGKTLDYYNITFWANGQPDRRGGVQGRCVGYKNTELNTYLWHLLKPHICNGGNIVNVCEVPIRSTNLVPAEKKVECGQRLERGVLARSRVTNVFNEAQYGEFPSHCAVKRHKKLQGQTVLEFACSGVLINPNYVLTSAHCVAISTDEFVVSCGEWDLSGGTELMLESKVLFVKEVILHPGYELSDTQRHDIALLQLSEQFDVDSYAHIGLCCLPTPQLFYQQSGVWDCFIVGWPKRRGTFRILKRLEVDLLSRIRCRSHMRRHNRHYYEYEKNFQNYGFDYDKTFAYYNHRYTYEGAAELLCTEPYESDDCVDDQSAMLVCRPAYYYTDDFEEYPGNFKNRFNLATKKIINAIGTNRFDGDKWYVLGISHGSSTCDRKDRKRYSRYQFFTQILKEMDFIHRHTDTSS